MANSAQSSGSFVGIRPGHDLLLGGDKVIEILTAFSLVTHTYLASYSSRSLKSIGDKVVLMCAAVCLVMGVSTKTASLGQ